MRTIILLLCGDHIALYENGGFEKIYVKGGERVPLRRSQLREDLATLKTNLCNEANVDSADDFAFILLENADPQLNKAVKDEFNVKASVPVDLLLREAIEALSKKTDLMVERFGLNFDGRSYLVSENCIGSAAFSLFAHTIQDDELIAACGEAIRALSQRHKIS